jgi:hypothetical protein
MAEAERYSDRVGMLLRALASNVSSKYLPAIGLEAVVANKLHNLVSAIGDDVRAFELALERGEHPRRHVDVPERFEQLVQSVNKEAGAEAAARLRHLGERIPSLRDATVIEGWLKVMSTAASGSPPLSAEGVPFLKAAARKYDEEVKRWIRLLQEDDREPSRLDWPSYMHSEDYLVRGFIQSLIEFQNVDQFQQDLRSSLTDDDWRRFLKWGQSVLGSRPSLMDAWKRTYGSELKPADGPST